MKLVIWFGPAHRSLRGDATEVIELHPHGMHPAKTAGELEDYGAVVAEFWRNDIVMLVEVR